MERSQQKWSALAQQVRWIDSKQQVLTQVSTEQVPQQAGRCRAPGAGCWLHTTQLAQRLWTLGLPERLPTSLLYRKSTDRRVQGPLLFWQGFISPRRTSCGLVLSGPLKWSPAGRECSGQRTLRAWPSAVASHKQLMPLQSYMYISLRAG